MKKLAFLIIIQLFTTSLWAQNDKKIDSLLKVLSTQKQDTNKLLTLGQLGNYYVAIDGNKTVDVGKQALKIAENLKNPKFIFRAYATIGKGYFRLNEYQLALENLNKGLAMKENEVQDLDKSLAIGNVANCYFGLGDFPKAINAGFQSVQLKEKVLRTETDAVKIKKIKNSIATTYGNIGSNYERVGDDINALKYLNKSIEISKENGDDDISVVLTSIGNIYKHKNDHKNAAKYAYESFELSKRIGNKFNACLAAINLSGELATLKQKDSVLKYAQIGLNLSNELKSEYHQALAILNFASIYEEENNIPLATEFYKKGIELAIKCENVDLQKYAYYALSVFYEKIKDYKESNSAFKKYILLKDSLSNNENTKALLNAELKYDYNKKSIADSILNANEKFIASAKLSKQKNQKLAYASLALLALTAVGFTFYQYKQKQKTNSQLTEINNKINKQNNTLKTLNTELIESEEKLTTANNSKEQLISMMSHDLLNPITAITNYNQQIITKKTSNEDLLQAFKRVDAAIQPMHGLLDNMLQWTAIQKDGIKAKLKNQDVNEIAKEIISIYRPQANLKFIKINDALQDDFVMETDKLILSLILRNLLNNAIKYSANDTSIFITTNATEKTITIQDEGFGMTDEMIDYLNNNQIDKIEAKGSGLGLKLCYEFVEAVGGKIFFKTNNNEQGVQAKITL
ncbi:MAG: tetratricopeptide repeat-containing sensor histidine kinase [Ferruginibacter sp.]